MSCSYNRCSNTRSCCANNCGCKRYPFYTGPCPSACGCNHCHHHCGCNHCGCTNCGCTNAQVTMDWNYGCSNGANYVNTASYANAARSASSGCGCSGSCGCNNNCGCGNGCGNCSCGSNCGCNDCECDSCGCGCPPMPPPLPPVPPVEPCLPLSGNFFSAAPLTVAAGGNIPLVASGAPAGYTVENGAVQIQNPGTYYLSYTVSVPADTALATVITPALNGASLPAGAVTVDAVATDGPLTLSGQTVFVADAGARLSLVSSEALSLPGATPFVNLSLLRISC